MKKNKLLGLILIPLFLIGCATSPSIHILNERFIKDIGPNDRISLVEFKAKHYGSMGAQFGSIFGGPCIAFAVGSSEQRENPKITPVNATNIKEKSYVRKLDEECLKTIESVLKQSSDFKYVSLRNLKHGQQNYNEDSDKISHLCKLNNLNGIIKIYIIYGITSGFKKPLTLTIDWIIFGSDGKEDVKCHTISATKKGYDHFPNTRNPKYENIYIKLAQKSAEEFLLMLSEKKPKIGVIRGQNSTID